MNKAVTRPLLVGIVERWRALEQQAFRALPESAELTTKQAQAQAEWATAHRELTQAETLLWLADQQWEREEVKALAYALETSNQTLVQSHAHTLATIADPFSPVCETKT